MTRRRALSMGMAVVVLLVVAALVRIEQIHHTDGRWSLFQSAAPLVVSYKDRDYRRTVRRTTVPSGEVVVAETSGGGTIYAPPDAPTPTVIHVIDEDEVWTYSLSGGP